MADVVDERRRRSADDRVSVFVRGGVEVDEPFVQLASAAGPAEAPSAAVMTRSRANPASRLSRVMALKTAEDRATPPALGLAVAAEAGG